MKKIKVLFFLLISIIFSACHDGTIGGSGNIGYQTPALSTFAIEFEYYSTNEKVESFILKSKDMPSYDYELIRLDEDNVYLAISVSKIFEKKKAKIHQECVIYGVNDKTQEIPENTYSSLDNLYIAIYQNNDGPWDVIDPLKAPAILLNKEEGTSSFVPKLTGFKAVLTTN
jgi:hypothetical protein